MLKQILIFFGLLIITSGLFAEGLPDTTIYLHELSINSNIVQNFSAGNKIQKLPKKIIRTYKSSSLRDILSDHSMVNIKSYGVSGISNVSLRGSQTNQTAILWNGINLQDPLNGSADPSLMPLGLIDEIEIQYGGSGALYGSGSVGGVIMMKKNLDFNTGWGLEMSSGIGSFQHYKGLLSIKYGGQKYSGNLTYYHSQAENDFTYKNTQVFGHPEVRQENAATVANGLSQDNSFILSKSQKINTHLWYQNSRKHVGSNMTISGAQQFQDDESLRFSSDWVKYDDFITLMTRVAVIHSELEYNDPLLPLVAQHISNSFITQFETNITLSPKQLLNIGVNNRLDMADSDNIPESQKRNTAAIFLSYKLQLLKRKLNIVASIRDEMIQEKLSSPTPSLGIDWNPNKTINFKAKTSRNYRTPTFNDLYWKGSFAYGNPDLLSESGWTQELGFGFNKRFKRYNSSIQINAFNSNINNLIVWLPDSAAAWTPVNKKKVWSRGVEIQSKTDFYLNKWITGFHFYYTYNPSTLNNGDFKGKQLIYQPLHQVKEKIYVSYKTWTLNIILQYFTERFITEDNSKSLDAYQMVNLSLHKDINIKKHHFSFHLRANNILNQEYQSVENYATPLQNYQFSIQYKINQK